MCGLCHSQADATGCGVAGVPTNDGGPAASDAGATRPARASPAPVRAVRTRRMPFPFALGDHGSSRRRAGDAGPMSEFDVIVVGAGPAGENAAGRVADNGLSVAIIERELVGGECSYWGCIPSKTLLRPGDVIAAARRVPGAAEAVTGRIDVDAALARRDYMTSSWDDKG